MCTDAASISGDAATSCSRPAAGLPARARLPARSRRPCRCAGADPCASAAAGANPFAPRPPHFKPRATAVISLFMSGGWSQVDTFDPKPALTKYAGQPLDGKVAGDILVAQGSPGPLMPSPFAFKRHGQSGIEISEIFPAISRHADEMAFVRSVHGRSNDHVQATYEMQTGQITLGFPSVGSWVTYGLGSASVEPPCLRRDDRRPRRTARRPRTTGARGSCRRPIRARCSVPAAIRSSISNRRRRSRPRSSGSGSTRWPGSTRSTCRSSPATRSWPRGFRPTSWPTGCRGAPPTAIDVDSESEQTRKLYGLDDKVTEPFGRQCLMARRLVERGVRFVQIYAGGVGNQPVDTWDAHVDVKANHTQHAAETDKPMADC